MSPQLIFVDKRPMIGRVHDPKNDIYTKDNQKRPRIVIVKPERVVLEAAGRWFRFLVPDATPVLFAY